MKILLAVDGSAPSQEAIDEVAGRPWPQPTTVRVISAVQPYAPPAGEIVPGAVTAHAVATQAVGQQYENQAKAVVSDAVDRIGRSGLSAEAVVRDGDPRTVIVDEANDWGANLIVVGSHGHTGLKRLLLGSVAQAVVGRAPCSVEVVRHRQT
jgi:nucleotide-binding universal stress UspA family protein